MIEHTWIHILGWTLYAAPSVHGLYDIRCGPVNSTLLSWVTAPLRDSVAAFLHSTCPVQGGIFDGTALQIATWPQYANVSADQKSITVHVQGYAYALPQCAANDTAGHELLSTLMELIGGTTADLTPRGAMPNDFLSWSVSGAALTLSTSHTTDDLPGLTGTYGHFDGYKALAIPSETLISEISLTAVNLSVGTCESQSPSNATYLTPATTALVYVVPPTGVTIVSDLDDILRVAEIWNYKQTLLSTFVRPFEVWLNMDSLYAHWKRTVPEIHFHYTTDAPEMLYNFYVDGIQF